MEPDEMCTPTTIVYRTSPRIRKGEGTLIRMQAPHAFYRRHDSFEGYALFWTFDRAEETSSTLRLLCPTCPLTGERARADISWEDDHWRHCCLTSLTSLVDIHEPAFFEYDFADDALLLQVLHVVAIEFFLQKKSRTQTVLGEEQVLWLIESYYTYITTSRDGTLGDVLEEAIELTTRFEAWTRSASSPHCDAIELLSECGMCCLVNMFMNRPGASFAFPTPMSCSFHVDQYVAHVEQLMIIVSLPKSRSDLVNRIAKMLSLGARCVTSAVALSAEKNERGLVCGGECQTALSPFDFCLGCHRVCPRCGCLLNVTCATCQCERLHIASVSKSTIVLIDAFLRFDVEMQRTRDVVALEIGQQLTTCEKKANAASSQWQRTCKAIRAQHEESQSALKAANNENAQLRQDLEERARTLKSLRRAAKKSEQSSSHTELQLAECQECVRRGAVEMKTVCRTAAELEETIARGEAREVALRAQLARAESEARVGRRTAAELEETIARGEAREVALRAQLACAESDVMSSRRRVDVELRLVADEVCCLERADQRRGEEMLRPGMLVETASSVRGTKEVNAIGTQTISPPTKIMCTQTAPEARVTRGAPKATTSTPLDCRAHTRLEALERQVMAMTASQQHHPFDTHCAAYDAPCHSYPYFHDECHFPPHPDYAYPPAYGPPSHMPMYAPPTGAPSRYAR